MARCTFAIRRHAFSLIELVIVIVIIGILAAIAIPRFGAGSVGASESALKQNVSSFRLAIEHYAAEHATTYPTCTPVGDDKTTIMLQLTQYTDDFGNFSPTRSSVYRLGPYLQKIPPVTVGNRKGSSRIDLVDAPGVGWLYNPSTGVISSNTDAVLDSTGTRAYTDY